MGNRYCAHRHSHTVFLVVVLLPIKFSMFRSISFSFQYRTLLLWLVIYLCVCSWPKVWNRKRERENGAWTATKLIGNDERTAQHTIQWNHFPFQQYASFVTEERRRKNNLFYLYSLRNLLFVFFLFLFILFCFVVVLFRWHSPSPSLSPLHILQYSDIVIDAFGNLSNLSQQPQRGGGGSDGSNNAIVPSCEQWKFLSLSRRSVCVCLE